MALNFYSKQIEKEISLDQLSKLKSAELVILKDELQFAIASMDNSLLEVKKQKEENNEPYDVEWHQRVRRKQKVCEAFLIEIAEQDAIYEIMYKTYFSELLLEKIGMEEYNQLEKDAKIKTEFKLLKLKKSS
tara:strand:- start:71 stop:466 length:396 start_codon:yes stop_codon:yes gene_type:complete